MTHDHVPKHVAIIMDGNGRWAAHKGNARTAGHKQGSHAVRRIVRECRRLGVRALTLYAFSEQNWDRPSIEVDALMMLLREYLLSERTELLDNQIRLRALGRSHKLPESVREVLDPLVEETHAAVPDQDEGMTLSLALSYGGQEELADAAAALALLAQRGELDPRDINVDALRRALPSMTVGPVDLLIRTGGDQRISNFLLFGAAYAELHFTDKLWPDFDVDDLHAAFKEFEGRERRFGLVPDAPDWEPLPHER